MMKYKLVPIEPTEEMLKAAWKAQYIHVGGSDEDSNKLSDMRVNDMEQRKQDVVAYKAMLSAAPTPAQPEKVDVEAIGFNTLVDGWMLVSRQNGTIEHVKTAATLMKDAAEYERVKKERDELAALCAELTSKNIELLKKVRNENGNA